MGDVTLGNLGLTDSRFGTIALNVGTLAPQATTVAVRTYTVVETDVPGPLANTATATANPPAGLTALSVQATGSVELAYQARLTVTREVTPPEPAAAGDTLAYTFHISNTGDLTISGLTANDSRTGNVPLSTSTLAPGASTTAQLSIQVQQADLPGPLFNTLTVVGTPSANQPVVTVLNTGAVALIGNPNLLVTQSVNTAQANVGETINFTYKVQNIGGVALDNVVVSYDHPSNVTLPAFSLEPGQSMSGATSYEVKESDVPGPIINTVTATGTPRVGGGQPVTAVDADAVTVLGDALLQVVMQPNTLSANVGDTIQYTYKVLNVGTLTLENVQAVDSRLGPITLGANNLAPGASTTGLLTYKVVESDLPGPLASLVQVTGKVKVSGATVTSVDGASVTLADQPALKIDATIDHTTANVGETIVYGYKITNVGNVTLVAVNGTGSKLGTLLDQQIELAPGESKQWQGSYVAGEGDLPGPLVLSLSVTGKSKYGTGDWVTVTDSREVQLTSHSGVNVVEEVSTAQANVGETVDYVFTVENTGDVTLKDIQLTDSLLGDLLLDTTALAPGAKVTRSVPYVVQATDMPGPLNNQVTVTAQPVGNPAISDSANGSVSITSSSLTLQHEVRGTASTLPVFNFQMNGKAFQLQDGETRKFEWLTPGTKTIEITTRGWDVVEIQCTGTTATVALTKANLTLARGQDVTCTVFSELGGNTEGQGSAFALYIPTISK